LGRVGLDWQVGRFGNFSSRGTSEMIMRHANTGAFEVYNIANNQSSRCRRRRMGEDYLDRSPSTVMAGLGPAIHVFVSSR